jgi:ABC-2 type transport system ATP-binding protein
LADLSSKPANVDGTVLEMTVDNGPFVTADALRRIDGANIALSGLALREPSLDDVFLSLTGHKAEELDEDAPKVRGRRGRRKGNE